MPEIKSGLDKAQLDSLKDGKIDICDLLAKQDNSNASKVKAALFFTNINNDGYFEKLSFIPWLTGLKDTERRNFKLMLEYMANKQKINSLPYVKTDRFGNKYIWLVFQLAQSRQEFKIAMGGKLDEFIKDYQLGLVLPDFDLNALYLEAQIVAA